MPGMKTIAASKEDRQIMKVQNSFASTTMLYTIEAAHIPYTDNHDDTKTVSINSSFFLHAGGQNTQDLTPIEQDGEPSDHTESHTGSEGYNNHTQSEDDNSHFEGNHTLVKKRTMIMRWNQPQVPLLLIMRTPKANRKDNHDNQ